jgi:hypothetical protein
VVRDGGGGGVANVYCWGRNAEGELGILLCARVAHEANRAYCISLGDPSQVYFDDAPQWQRDSAITGVRGVLRGNGSRESHESWLKEKLNAGWTYGPVKDADKKTHPCFVHYDDLPPAQRKKDEIFVGVVRVMAAALGLPLATCSCEGQRPFEPIRSMTELLDEAARCSIHGKKENE